MPPPAASAARTAAIFSTGTLLGPPDRLPASSALRACLGDAGAHPLHDHRALEFREHPEHLKHRLAGRRAGIEPLPVEIQIHPSAVNLAKEADEIL
jgi:hypothetical protein